MKRRGVTNLTRAIVWWTIGCGAIALAKDAPPQKRARPPRWSADVLDTFFVDAREKLEGTRPDYGQTNVEAVAASGAAPAYPGSDTMAGTGWSKLIDAETIETEIKRLTQAVATDVTTPGPFKGGGYKACRRNFSVLAVLFGVAADYDGEVRWQDVAAGLREQFSRAGRNCKVGSDQTFQEAIQRKQELTDLVAGSRPQVPQAESKVGNWAEVADRPPLMQRLNIAHQERLTKWLAIERDFKAHIDEIRHEAQVVAMLADVISREHFDYWDDGTYAGFAKELKESATEVAAAAESGKYSQAQQAIGRATKACANCHEGYRG